MNFLTDVITYVRRLIKTPSDAVLSDNLIIDYINRFWLMDVDARMQLFDLKTTYQLITQPGVDQYNMPLYTVQIQPGTQIIGMFPVYQGFLSPCYINGIEVPLYTQKANFFNIWPNVTQNLGVIGQGDGTQTYSLQLPIISSNAPQNPPFNGLLRGHVDTTGIMALGTNVDPPVVDSVTAQTSIPTVPSTSVQAGFFLTTLDASGENVVVTDSGQFLDGNINYGLLMEPGKAPNGNLPLIGGYSTSSNTINYFTGEINVTFPVAIPSGVNITANCFYFQSGLPRSILFYNNTLTLRSPPDQQYLVNLDAYLTPAAFLNTTSAIPFGYMSEYIARGAARKILSDTGDWEQFDRYEPLFREQELLVWKRSQRQWTATRTNTIYNQSSGQGYGYNNFGGQS